MKFFTSRDTLSLFNYIISHNTLVRHFFMGPREKIYRFAFNEKKIDFFIY